MVVMRGGGGVGRGRVVRRVMKVEVRGGVGEGVGGEGGVEGEGEEEGGGGGWDEVEGGEGDDVGVGNGGREKVGMEMRGGERRGWVVMGMGMVMGDWVVGEMRGVKVYNRMWGVILGMVGWGLG